ncbi:MAG: putative deoxyribonuclease RhsC, partial [Herminiimonas sp.]|nr:putative deoxyribonuclease RhsC [Herminiimonas sp.]
DTNNNLVWRWDNGDPFGVAAPDQNPSGLGVFEYNLRFPGQIAGKETYLVQNGARDYDAMVGRYVQSDPIGLEGGINTYSYVNNQPTRYTDPFGLNPFAGAVAGAEMGAAFGPVGAVVGAAAGAWAGWNIVGPMFAKPPENAYDPQGPKAPGKPGEAEGFKDPKGGENWVPNPNPGKGGSSHGWQDAKGDVWCPTGPGGRGHSGPHWDVQTPGGDYRNVKPSRWK